MQSCLPIHMAAPPPSIIGAPCKPVPAILTASPVKDSRWLTLEVCREFARNKCPRSENECRYAHPPSDVEIQTGRVVCCFDSIKGRCQRTNPPCKYLHPPQHLKEQLLQNGRNNLIRRNLQINAATTCFLPAMYSMYPPLIIDGNHSGYFAPPVLGTPLSIPVNFQLTNNNVANSNALNNNTLPAIMPATQNSNINNNINNNGEPQERMSYSPTTSSPICVVNPEQSNGQHYWPQGQIIDSSRDALSAYYSPLIYQNVGTTPGYYSTVLKPTADSKTCATNGGGLAIYPCGLQYTNGSLPPSPYHPATIAISSVCQPAQHCYPIPVAIASSVPTPGITQRY